MSVFLDTNILLYCFDESEVDKRPVALELIAKLLQGNESVMISTQVAIEFLNRVQRSKSPPTQRTAQVESLQLFHCQPTTINTVRAAWALSSAHTVSWFDALIVQSALDANCSQLYSEDLQGGRVFSGRLTVINPFEPT